MGLLARREHGRNANGSPASMALAMRGQVKKRVLGADDMWAWAACEFGLSDAGVVFGEERLDEA